MDSDVSLDLMGIVWVMPQVVFKASMNILNLFFRWQSCHEFKFYLLIWNDNQNWTSRYITYYLPPQGIGNEEITVLNPQKRPRMLSSSRNNFKIPARDRLRNILHFFQAIWLKCLMWSSSLTRRESEIFLSHPFAGYSKCLRLRAVMNNLIIRFVNKLPFNGEA